MMRPSNQAAAHASHAAHGPTVRAARWPFVWGCMCLMISAHSFAAAPPAGTAAAQGGAAAGAAAPASAGSQVLDEIAVVGERPGPRLWKISKGDHVLWLLGTLTHIPRRMTWRSSEVETALAGSQEMLDSGVSVSAGIGPIGAVKLYFQWRHIEKNPGHTELRSWVPAPLYARFEAVKANFDNGDRGIEELRPSLAALRLYDKAVDAAGLTERDNVEQEVERLAKKQHVPVRKPKLQVNDPSGALKEIGDLPPSLEVECLEATVTRIETDLQNMQQRAVAWSVGDIERLRSLTFSNQRDVCVTAISNSPRMKALFDTAQQAWMDEAEASLIRNRVTFAMRPIYDLLDRNGPLARFRAEGYRIDGPG
jgi:uncharacterized protein YbaP (TraB family)